MKNKLRTAGCLALLGIAAATFLGPRSCAQDQTAPDEVYELHNARENGITAPKPIHHTDPDYTDRARKKKISGVVLLSIVVTTEGTVRDAKVTTSLDKDLDQQALKAVNQWTFQPATKDGKPVPVRISVEVSFNIR